MRRPAPGWSRSNCEIVPVLAFVIASRRIPPQTTRGDFKVMRLNQA
jgi:hypothetical protein